MATIIMNNAISVKRYLVNSLVTTTRKWVATFLDEKKTTLQMVITVMYPYLQIKPQNASK